MRGSKIPVQELWLKMGGGRIREGGRNSGILRYKRSAPTCASRSMHMGNSNQFMVVIELPKGAIVELELTSSQLICDRKC